MNVESIDDVSSTVDNTEAYIRDLELEIASLTTKVNRLNKQLKKKPNDINCCEAYAILVKNFHNLINDILPF